MKNFIKAMNDLPFILKLILCIPALDIIWAVYRIVKGITKESLVQIIVGVLWIVPGAVFLWLVDIIGVLLYQKVPLSDL